ncbi:hypothetical protein llap_5807 [Limosa lapponica baueri]|uniref:Uncharacterized protein n=1 Tax=Limosa lapponica baueri TaxID=1758121 RepID=A0A2I0UCU3_LIMLA|nr:hypothetical protein llap_5807 [Limosa lapponica baueri]
MERITSLNLSATLLPRQPRTLVACFATRAESWPMFYLVATRTPLICNLLAPMRQNFAISLVKLHEVPASPFLQPVKAQLNGSVNLGCTIHSSQFWITSKLAAGTLFPIIQIINESVEEALIQ